MIKNLIIMYFLYLIFKMYKKLHFKLRQYQDKLQHIHLEHFNILIKLIMIKQFGLMRLLFHTTKGIYQEIITFQSKEIQMLTIQLTA